ncbi:MAG: nitrate/nitrite transporter [Rubrivivax sp.]|nr:nitrate/nitrite transporter [Rubrivivax sp.]
MVAHPVIAEWNPEDRGFWSSRGRRVAQRNLWLSIPALVLSFAVWMLWSVLVVHLPAAGFRYSTNQLFWLAALPALCGATLRIFYAFFVPVVGGRRFTALATASLLLPAVGIGLAVQDPGTPYEWMIVLALLCGLGGGNFASSMAHISHFFPKSRKGWALGLNAGLGNLGVWLVQLVVPLVVTAGLFGALGGAPQVVDQGPPLWLQNAGFVWVPLIAASALAAWFGMDDLAVARAGFAEQAVIFTRRHNWLLCWLYLGTFGSFLGHAAGFPLLLASQFPQVDALACLAWASAGPLLGALARPLGGAWADRLGGARVTLWTFVAMTAGVLAVLASLPGADRSPGSVPGFVAAYLLLFAAAGVGNGSTFRMIPLVFLELRQQAAQDLGPQAQAQAVREGNTEGAAALGFASAIGAYGGFFIPKSFGSSIALTGGPAFALATFAAFYLSCIAITWWYYARRHAPVPC